MQFAAEGYGDFYDLTDPVDVVVNPADGSETITPNPADALKLAHKGRIAVGKDADFVLLSEDLVIDTVIAKGQTMVVGGEPIVWGTFEEKK